MRYRILGDQMMKIEVKQIVGSRCITSEDGQKLYNQIHKTLESGGDVKLDFDGITVFSTPFFNFAIGQLYRDLKSEQLQAHLTPENLNNAGKMVLQRVLKNSKDYYSNPLRRKAVEQVTKRLSEE